MPTAWKGSISFGLVGIGKIQFGNREHLTALKAESSAILINLMHFAEEREDPKSLKFRAQGVTPGKKELDLAKQLVGTLKVHFKPEEFENAHRARIEETIRQKASQATVATGEARAKAGKGKVIDLMERLKQSLRRARVRRLRISAKPLNPRRPTGIRRPGNGYATYLPSHLPQEKGFRQDPGAAGQAG